MHFRSWIGRRSTIARLMTVAIFFSLIRCITEPFRLQYTRGEALALDAAKPYLLGALVAAVALLIMTVVVPQRHTAVIVIAWLTIGVLLVIKGVYLGF